MIRIPAAALALALLIAAPILASAADPAAVPAPAFTEATRAALISGAEKAIGDYVFAAKVAPLSAILEQRRAAYLQIADRAAFVEAVNADLYAVAHDKHLRLKYSVLAEPMFGERPTAASMAHLRRSEELINFGYAAAAVLLGNVGYIRLDEFGGMPESQPAIDAAMALVKHTDALIFDVRANHGGDPDSLDYLMGYFYAKPVELTSLLVTQDGKTQLYKQFSSAKVSGPRYLGKPLYVLTSDHTFSCAEQFAYDMKSLHRATLIGMVTGGGANPGDFVHLDDHFAIFIPTGRALNPYTKTNWEGVGVAPDVPTTAAAALLAAYTRALGASQNSFDEAALARAQALKNPASALAASLPAP
ncbi:MAG TPA: S41 family peptidase [Candidatus Tumulicola sp.]